MAAPGIVMVKEFPWKGEAEEEWSNGYHIQGDAPANGTEWEAQIGALLALEQPIFPSEVKFVRALCYDDFDGSHANVYSHDFTTDDPQPVGTHDGSGQERHTGQTAMVCRWGTGRFNTKGKPVYLYKYFHGALTNGTGLVGDQINAGQAASLATFVDDVMVPGDVWQGMAGPDGVAPTTAYVNPYLGDHQLKRRGKRPNP